MRERPLFELKGHRKTVTNARAGPAFPKGGGSSCKATEHHCPQPLTLGQEHGMQGRDSDKAAKSNKDFFEKLRNEKCRPCQNQADPLLVEPDAGGCTYYPKSGLWGPAPRCVGEEAALCRWATFVEPAMGLFLLILEQRRTLGCLARSTKSNLFHPEFL